MADNTRGLITPTPKEHGSSWNTWITLTHPPESILESSPHPIRVKPLLMVGIGENWTRSFLMILGGGGKTKEISTKNIGVKD